MSRSEVTEKLGRLKALLKERDLDAIITVDADAISGAKGRARLDQLAASVKATGGRTPGASRVHPSKITSEKCTIAPAVTEELNIWAERLGVAARI
jgi:(2R)-3-sulfolactate dehydrogenase (NADP+)